MVIVKVIKPGAWSVELTPVDKVYGDARGVANRLRAEGLDARKVKGKDEVHVMVPA